MSHDRDFMTSSNTPSPLPRRANIGDLNALVELENQIFQYDQLSKKSFLRFIKSENDLWVIEQENKLAGYVLVLKRKGSKKMRIYSLAVSPHFQGQGIGRKLLEYALSQIDVKNTESIRLEVKVDNVGAIKLYESLGFIRKDITSEFYSDGTSAYVYMKYL